MNYDLYFTVTPLYNQTKYSFFFICLLQNQDLCNKTVHFITPFLLNTNTNQALFPAPLSSQAGYGLVRLTMGTVMNNAKCLFVIAENNTEAAWLNVRGV